MLKSCVGTTKSLRRAVTKEYVVQSIIGTSEDDRFNRSTVLISYRYDMDFGGFLYSSSAFIRHVALAVALNHEQRL